MSGFIEGENRDQAILFPECFDDYVTEDNPVRVVDVFVDNLDLAKLGFERSVARETGQPGYHPATLLKIYIYGYLNRVQSSRRLEVARASNLIFSERTSLAALDIGNGRNSLIFKQRVVRTTAQRRQ